MTLSRRGGRFCGTKEETLRRLILLVLATTPRSFVASKQNPARLNALQLNSLRSQQATHRRWAPLMLSGTPVSPQETPL